MRIIFASHHCCTRTVKEGLALVGQGHEVIFLQWVIGNKSFEALLPGLKFYSDLDHFKAIIKHVQADIIHCHNFPDTLVTTAKENTNIPVIYDAHDLNSVYRDDDPELLRAEEAAVEACDAIVVPSLGYKNYLESRYMPTKPILALPPMCNRWMLKMTKAKLKLALVNGIVFEGGIADMTAQGEVIYDWARFRDYRPLSRELNAAGIPMHFYIANPRYKYAYLETGAEVTSRLLFNEMLHRITRYDWGFCGTPLPSPQWDWAMPNKLFEYICAGIPVIVMNAAECADFVQELEVGIVVKSVNEIKARYDEHKKLKPNVLKVRETLLMENQITELESLYKRVLEKANDVSYYTDPDGGLRIRRAG